MSGDRFNRDLEFALQCLVLFFILSLIAIPIYGFLRWRK